MRTAVAIASLLAMPLGGFALYWLLGDRAAHLPFHAQHVFLLLAWLGLPLLAMATAFPWPRSRKRCRLEKAGGMARLVLGLIGLAAFFLLTDVGIFAAGHKYWIERAFSAPTDTESRRCLNVVFHSTQYGRDILENELESLPPGERRRQLEIALRELKGTGLRSSPG